jgi:hypothetical protein
MSSISWDRRSSAPSLTRLASFPRFAQTLSIASQMASGRRSHCATSQATWLVSTRRNLATTFKPSPGWQLGVRAAFIALFAGH